MTHFMNSFRLFIYYFYFLIQIQLQGPEEHHEGISEQAACFWEGAIYVGKKGAVVNYRSWGFHAERERGQADPAAVAVGPRSAARLDYLEETGWNFPKIQAA